MIINYAALAASIQPLCHTDSGRYPVTSCALPIVQGQAAPPSPVASRRPYLYMPGQIQAHTAQTGNRQKTPVCDTFSSIILLLYGLRHIRHRQIPIYRMTRARARAVKRHNLLSILYYFKEKRLCHCALPVLTRLCVCSFRMFLSVPCVPKGECNGF
jgi:hypothetical protein